MKIIKLIIFSIVSVFILNGCRTTLMPATVIRHSSLDQYKYFYIDQTNELTSGVSDSYGTQNGLYGFSQTKTVNPSDLISGFLLKKGFTKLPEIKTNLLKETLIINYGESGRRNVGILGAYTIEVVIQFISAETHSVICSGVAEGMGSTEADDIRIAINRCLDKIFSIDEQ